MKTFWITPLNSMGLFLDTVLKHFKGDPLWARLTVLFGVLVIGCGMLLTIAYLWFSRGL